MSDWGKDDKVVGSDDWGKNDVVVGAKPVATAPQEDPGWFQPGSKSEAAVRGFSQAATLGFGDEIQAALRSLTSDDKYADLRDQERTANANSASTNPGSYLAGGVAASIPTGAAGLGKTVAGTVVKSAGLGAINGLGHGEGSASEQALSTAKGAGIGAVTGGLGATATKVARVAPAVVGKVLQDPTVAGAGIGAVSSKLSGGSAIEGAVIGGLAGRAGKGMGPKVAGWAGKQGGASSAPIKSGGTGSTVAKAAPNIMGLALQRMSGQEARRINDESDQVIRAKAAEGQPIYAATFQQLNSSPAYRIASEKVAAQQDKNEVDGDEDETNTDEN